MAQFNITRRRVAALLGWSWVGAAHAAPWPGVLLAREAAADVDPTGYLVSEKYDGVRALWDGSILRFRSGRTIAAPAWFTQRLPVQALDGELWLGRGRFEATAAAVRRERPDEAEWRALRYMVFDLPSAPGGFQSRAERLRLIAAQAGWPALAAIEQQRLPDRATLRRRLEAVLAAGGEGLMLHRADAPWVGGRSDTLLKLKPVHDDDAVVVGHEPGRGRHLGRLGALRVRRADGTEFRIGTGFTDAQRDAPPAPGRTITYTHRGHTRDGVPRFASFLRVLPDL
jgi:DNA ligase-1